MFYAEIDENGIVFGVSNLAKVVEKPTLIGIDSLDSSLIGKKYQNGEFIDVPIEPHIPTYEEEKTKYLNLIRDAKDLGEVAEADRLKLEWYNLKLANGWLQEGEQPPTTTATTEELSTVIDTMLGEEGGTV